MRFKKSQIEALVKVTKPDGRVWSDCIRFEANRMIATDGHRLVIVEADAEQHQTEPAAKPFSVAWEDCKRVAKAMGPNDTATVRESMGEAGKVVFTLSTGPTLSGSLVNGDYCQYEKVIPPESDTENAITFDASYLRDICDAAVKNSSTKITPIKLCVRKDPTLNAMRIESQGGMTFVLMPMRA